MKQLDLDSQTHEPPNHCYYCQKVISSRARYCCNAHRQASYRARIRAGEFSKPRPSITIPTYGLCTSCYDAPATIIKGHHKLCPMCHMELQEGKR